MHVLDNPVWHALTGTHATVAERRGSAARYVPDVAVFAALSDDTTPAGWDALASLAGPAGMAFLARRDLTVPDSWTERVDVPCHQMWLRDPNVPTEPRADPDVTFVTLGAADVDDMLALVHRTRPGPFLARTVELGTYLGVRDGGQLVAMAGERLHPPGFTEISVVCTDPVYRGRGLASRLVTAIVAGIRARDETPFLHLTVDNDDAHRVYAALGFETRTSLSVVGVQAPG
jgi:ribosomal protein S18 acetylase RimI-like enzyme